jgi:hypothetical protein
MVERSECPRYGNDAKHGLRGVAIEHSRRASFSQHKPTYCIAELPPRSRYGLAHDTPRIARGVHTAERPRG